VIDFLRLPILSFEQKIKEKKRREDAASLENGFVINYGIQEVIGFILSSRHIFPLFSNARSYKKK
jgi:hypothetical protein